MPVILQGPDGYNSTIKMTTKTTREKMKKLSLENRILRALLEINGYLGSYGYYDRAEHDIKMFQVLSLKERADEYTRMVNAMKNICKNNTDLIRKLKIILDI